jgi:DNA-binding transcriptional regulator WhiA
MNKLINKKQKICVWRCGETTNYLIKNKRRRFFYDHVAKLKNERIYCKCGCGILIDRSNKWGTKKIGFKLGHQNKNRIFSEEWKNNIRKANIGKKYHDITKEKKRLLALKKNPINTNYFKKLNKRNAYVLGYLFADGNLHERKKSKGYMLSIFSKDKELIDKIKNEFLILHRKTTIHTNKSIKYYGLQITNYHFLKFLKRLGLKSGKKSNRISISNKILKNKSLFSNFVRGFFDGDGWISSFKLRRTPTVTLVTASSKFLSQLKRYMNKFDIVSGKISRLDKTNAFRLSFYSKKNVHKFYKFIYRNSDNLYLIRKKQRFEEYFKAYNWKTI